MRTTLDINDALLRRAKEQAAKEQTTMKSIVERALRRDLLRSARNSDYQLKWRPEKGRLQPGVRLEDRDALFDLMEGRS